MKYQKQRHTVPITDAALTILKRWQEMGRRARFVFDLLNASEAVKRADKEDKIENWVAKLVDNVSPSLRGYTREQIDLATGLLVYELYERDGSYRNIYEAYTSMVNGGVK